METRKYPSVYPALFMYMESDEAKVLLQYCLSLPLCFHGNTPQRAGDTTTKAAINHKEHKSSQVKV